MKNTKRTLCALLSAILLLSPMSRAASLPVCTFSDVPSGYWAYDAIQSAVRQEITLGYPDGTFHPDAPVTNAQFIVFLQRAFFHEMDPVKETGQSWYEQAYQTLSGHDVLTGTGFGADMRTMADRPVSRYDMAQLLSNILQSSAGESI